VLANEVNVMIGNLPPWQGHLKAGKVQALAVTTATRNPGLPDVPALAETYPGFETVAWFGLLAPTGTPKAVVDRVNQAVNTALADPEVRSRIAATGCGPSPMPQEAWAARVQADITRWKKLASERNIRAD
jgi:tripartite-type tricarboxylate transporter receptor subunit TctC